MKFRFKATIDIRIAQDNSPAIVMGNVQIVRMHHFVAANQLPRSVSGGMKSKMVAANVRWRHAVDWYSISLVSQSQHTIRHALYTGQTKRQELKQLQQHRPNDTNFAHSTATRYTEWAIPSAKSCHSQTSAVPTPVRRNRRQARIGAEHTWTTNASISTTRTTVWRHVLRQRANRYTKHCMETRITAEMIKQAKYIERMMSKVSSASRLVLGVAAASVVFSKSPLNLGKRM